LFLRGVEKKKTVGKQQDSSIGNDKFSLEFHEALSLC
jgi:hypothetical protein